MNEIKLNGESEDIVQDNISKLKEIFPEIVTEDKIDFNKLKLILGDNIDESPEKYNFTWPGKIQSIKESQKTSYGTLRPCKEESKNWNSTENLYIEGDNLEVLKLLQKSYNNKIKMIYIDPPYNTGNDLIYQNDYSDNLRNYLEFTGQIDGERERALGVN
jgi:adenine specific DNA methylase Mod